MIYIPIYAFPTITTGSISTKHQQEIENKRNKILNIVKSYKNGLMLKEIAKKANYDIRRTEAILTVLKKQGKVESIWNMKKEKLWKIKECL